MRPGSSSQPSQCASSRPVQTVESRAQIRSTSSTASRELTREKLQHEPVELVRALEARNVRRRGDRRTARMRDRRLEPVGDRVHVGTILFADDDQRRDIDLAQALDEVRHERLLLCFVADRNLQLEGPPLHLADLVSHGSVDVCGLRPGPSTHIRRFTSTAASRSPRFDRRSLLGPAGLCLLRPVVAGQAGAHEHERGDELRPGNGDLERHAPSQRHADERGRAQLEPFEQPDEVTRVRERARRDRRLAEAAHVVANRPVQRRKRRPLRLPHPAVRDALVDEDDRWPLARDLVVQLSLASFGHAGASCPRLASMPSRSSRERVAELLDAFALERLADVVVVHARLGELLEEAMRLVHVLLRA